jgi:general secretion pathway protein G
MLRPLHPPRSHTRRRRAGLTLIEIMVVIAILGVLMTVLGGAMLGTLDSANVDATRLTMSKIDQALQIYAARHGGRYPTGSEGLEVAARFMADGKVPTDAWGNPFLYISPAVSGAAPYEVISLGKDGAESGEGYAADLSSLRLRLEDDNS